MREVCYLHLTRFVQILLDRKDRMSMASGLEVRVPFCDHRLVQYVFNTPWSLKTFDGREKSLLRAATRDVLPASIADRVKSPYPSTQDPGYEKAVRGDLADLLSDQDAPVRRLISPDKIREAVDAPERGQEPRGRPLADGERAPAQCVDGPATRRPSGPADWSVLPAAQWARTARSSLLMVTNEPFVRSGGGASDAPRAGAPRSPWGSTATGGRGNPVQPGAVGCTGCRGRVVAPRGHLPPRAAVQCNALGGRRRCGRSGPCRSLRVTASRGSPGRVADTMGAQFRGERRGTGT